MDEVLRASDARLTWECVSEHLRDLWVDEAQRQAETAEAAMRSLASGLVRVAGIIPGRGRLPASVVFADRSTLVLGGSGPHDTARLSLSTWPVLDHARKTGSGWRLTFLDLDRLEYFKIDCLTVSAT